MSIRLPIHSGVSVVAATGAGYQGVHMDPEAKMNVAEWKVPAIAPKQQQAYTITLSKALTDADHFRGEIRWAKPGPKSGPSSDVIAVALRPAG